MPAKSTAVQSLEGRARRRALTAVATTSRSCGSFVNLRRLRGGFALYPFLAGGFEQIGQVVSHGPPRHCGPRWGEMTVEGAQQRSARGFCFAVS